MLITYYVSTLIIVNNSAKNQPNTYINVPFGREFYSLHYGHIFLIVYFIQNEGWLYSPVFKFLVICHDFFFKVIIIIEFIFSLVYKQYIFHDKLSNTSSQWPFH